MSGYLKRQASGITTVANNKPFAPLVATIFTIIIVLYAVGVRYGDTADEQANNGPRVTHFYTFFIHVSIMIFIGFGYLMTFLKRYGYSAIGYNFMLSCLAFLWNVLCAGFWEHVYHRSSDYRIHLEFPLLIEGLFGAGSVMIAFGAVLGRTTISQLVLMAFLQIIPYSFNLYLGIWVLGAHDIGGSMIIHAFGAYFGLSVAWMMEYLKRRAYSSVGRQEEKPVSLGASTTSDITSMIGTIFLWIMWPSFNGVLASDAGRMMAISNTFLSLCASVIASFIVSILVSHKFDMVHVQNSTLAGGVAMGTAADLYTEPGGALGIGAFAGIISVLGYKYLTPYLERKIGLLDTCGVHNLHGMPGVIGGVVGIIVAAGSPYSNYLGVDPGFGGRSNQKQSHYQVYCLLHTLGIAVVSGLTTGWILSTFLPSVTGKDQHEDASAWEVQGDYHGEDAKVAKANALWKQAGDDGHVELANTPARDTAAMRSKLDAIEAQYASAKGDEPSAV